MLVKVKKPVRHGAHHARCPWSSPGGTHLSGMLHSSLFLKLSCRTLGKKEPEVQHQSSDLLLERQVGAPWCHLTPLCWAALIQLLNSKPLPHRFIRNYMVDGSSVFFSKTNNFYINFKYYKGLSPVEFSRFFTS